MSILTWLGLAVAAVGFAVVFYAVVASVSHEHLDARALLLRHVGWALILGGAALSLGAIAWRESPWLSVLVAGSFALLVARRFLITSRHN